MSLATRHIEVRGLSAGRVERDAVRILSKQIYFLEKLIKTTWDRARNLNYKSQPYSSHTDHEGIHYHVKMTKFATRKQAIPNNDICIYL